MSAVPIEKIYRVEGIDFDTYDAAVRHIRSIKLYNLLKNESMTNPADLMVVVDALIENQLEVIKILRD